ncbi:hypothetical protein DFH09DRAFT_1102062 [Mycena vulgaris]|nr:hypothetical protein DFH09DRAFT_1102062 [Mycena vulgaris]
MRNPPICESSWLSHLRIELGEFEAAYVRMRRELEKMAMLKQLESRPSSCAVASRELQIDSGVVLTCTGRENATCEKDKYEGSMRITTREYGETLQFPKKMQAGAMKSGEITSSTTLTPRMGADRLQSSPSGVISSHIGFVLTPRSGIRTCPNGWARLHRDAPRTEGERLPLGDIRLLSESESGTHYRECGVRSVRKSQYLGCNRSESHGRVGAVLRKMHDKSRGIVEIVHEQPRETRCKFESGVSQEISTRIGTKYRTSDSQSQVGLLAELPNLAHPLHRGWCAFDRSEQEQMERDGWGPWRGGSGDSSGFHIDVDSEREGTEAVSAAGGAGGDDAGWSSSRHLRGSRDWIEGTAKAHRVGMGIGWTHERGGGMGQRWRRCRRWTMALALGGRGREGGGTARERAHCSHLDLAEPTACASEAARVRGAHICLAWRGEARELGGEASAPGSRKAQRARLRREPLTRMGRGAQRRGEDPMPTPVALGLVVLRRFVPAQDREKKEKAQRCDLALPGQFVRKNGPPSSATSTSAEGEKLTRKRIFTPAPRHGHADTPGIQERDGAASMPMAL